MFPQIVGLCSVHPAYGGTKRYLLDPLSCQCLKSTAKSDAPIVFLGPFCRFVFVQRPFSLAVPLRSSCTFAHLLQDTLLSFFFILHLFPLCLRRPPLSSIQAYLLGSPFASLDARAK